MLKKSKMEKIHMLGPHFLSPKRMYSIESNPTMRLICRTEKMELHKKVDEFEKIAYMSPPESHTHTLISRGYVCWIKVDEYEKNCVY